MYRWVAIRGAPLCSYFTIEETPLKDLGPSISNLYLAEDRILCFEIVAKKHRQWLLKYVQGSVAETDAPLTLVELIKQRRRWLNGSFFATVYYLLRFGRMLNTNHSPFRKFLFFLQFLFNISQAVLAWFGVAFMLLSFLLIFNQSLYYAPFGQKEFRVVFILGYVTLLFWMVIAGLAGKINQMAQSYFAVMLTLITIMVLSLVLGTWLLFVGTITPFVGLGFALALFAYIVAAALHGALLKSCLFFVQYLVSVPVPLVMFPIYSFWYVHAPVCCLCALASRTHRARGCRTDDARPTDSQLFV
jgi:chitin synthase